MRLVPGRKRGTPEQAAAFDDARVALEADARWARRLGIRHETETFLDLNDRVIEAERPLSAWQRSLLASDLRIARRVAREVLTWRRSR
jgi:hypothetical protein